MALVQFVTLISHQRFAKANVCQKASIKWLPLQHDHDVSRKETSYLKIPESSTGTKALPDAMEFKLPEVLNTRHVEVVSRHNKTVSSIIEYIY